MPRKHFRAPAAWLKRPPLRRPAIVAPALALAATLIMAPVARAAVVEFQDAFTTADQSMWGTGTAAIVDFRKCLCDTWDKTVTSPSVSDAVGGGLFGPPNVSLSAALRGRTTGKAGIDIGFNFDSGSVDARTPVTTRFEYPGAGQLTAGQLFTLKASTVKGTDSFTTNFPELQAYVDAVLNVGLDLDLLATVKQDGVVKFNGPINLVNPGFTSTTELASFNRNSNGEAKILPALTGGLPGGFQFGEEQSIQGIGVEVATATVWIPDINTASTPTSSGASAAGATDLFAIQADLDGIATVASGGAVPPMEQSLKLANLAVGPANVSLNAGYNIVDVEVGPVIDINQAFDLATTVQTTLYFDRPVKIVSGGTLVEVTQLAVADIDAVQILFEGQDIGITAQNTINATLRNRTGLGFDFLLDVSALFAGLSLDADIDFGFPFGIRSFDLASLGIGPAFDQTFRFTGAQFGNVFDQTFALDGWQTLRNSFTISAQAQTAVPAPATLPLLVAVLSCLAIARRRRCG